MGTRYNKEDLVTPVGEPEESTGRDVEQGEIGEVDFINHRNESSPTYFLKPANRRKGLTGYKASNLELVERREDRDDITKWKHEAGHDKSMSFYRLWKNQETGLSIRVVDERDYGGGKIGYKVTVRDPDHDRIAKTVVEEKWKAIEVAEKVREDNNYARFNELDLPDEF